MGESRNTITPTSGMNPWRAGCSESCTSGSEGGPEKPTSRKADRALRPDPYPYYHWADDGRGVRYLRRYETMLHGRPLNGLP